MEADFCLGNCSLAHLFTFKINTNISSCFTLFHTFQNFNRLYCLHKHVVLLQQINIKIE